MARLPRSLGKPCNGLAAGHPRARVVLLASTVLLGLGSVPELAVASSHISLAAQSSIASGARLTFSGSSSYGAGSRERLTIYAARRSRCGHSARAPKGADVIFRGSVDNFLSISSFSDPLSSPGHWELCGYLSSHGKVKAHTSVGFSVR